MNRSRFSLLAIASVIGLAACGGDSDSTSTAAPSVADTGAPDDTTSDTAATASDDFTPGSDRYRVVNLLDEPVDIYARTTDGLVEAFLLQTGLAPSEISERYATPDPGTLAVLESGADDPACVATCPHILVQSRTNSDTGPLITEVLYTEDGTVRSFTVWENPPADGSLNANRMPDADSSTGLFVPLAVALTDADFGLQIADANGTGCLTNRDNNNVLVGGNQTPVFEYAGAAIEVTLHDNNDRDCSDEVVGGPFTITGGAGARTLLILTGSPGAMDAIPLPIGDSDSSVTPEPTEPTDEATGVATEAMATFLFDNLPVTETEAACMAAEMVNEIGADRLLASDGVPLDYANVDDELGGDLTTALFAAAPACGVDPDAV